MASAGQEASLFAVVFCLMVVAGNACLSLHGDAPATANFTQLAEVGGQVTANFTDLTAAAGLPATLDWRARGAVTTPKQQEKLGSCWAFAAVAAIEGLQQIRTGKLVTLSAQQLVDCAPETKTHRSPRNAFEWVHENGGITSDADYPYTGEAGKCVKSKLKHYSAQITGFRRTDNASELALMAALQKQPVAVSMALAGPFFTKYKAGTIYEGPCVQENNHAMTVVGYGQSKKGKLYWIVKNSFGPKWGNGGYVLVKRGVDSNNGGLCGIARRAIYPTMAAN